MLLPRLLAPYAAPAPQSAQHGRQGSKHISPWVRPAGASWDRSGSVHGRKLRLGRPGRLVRPGLAGDRWEHSRCIDAIPGLGPVSGLHGRHARHTATEQPSPVQTGSKPGATYRSARHPGSSSRMGLRFKPEMIQIIVDFQPSFAGVRAGLPILVGPQSCSPPDSSCFTTTSTRARECLTNGLDDARANGGAIGLGVELKQYLRGGSIM